MPKTSDIDRAIAQLESNIASQQQALAILVSMKKLPKVTPRKTRTAPAALPTEDAK